MNLAEEIAKESASIAAIQDALDALSHEERMDACMALGKKAQRRLFELAGENDPVDLDFFVPPNVPNGTPVTHHGRNTLPMFRRFKKPMFRPLDGSPNLYGYNDASTGWLIGPGYFVAHPTAGNPEWESRGAVVVNYYEVPPVETEVPEGWPKIKPNSSGLQTFVYNGTRDFMRKVSSHVSIGEAFRGEETINSWFVLVREDHA